MLASNTGRLDLYKVDPETDGNDTFNIDKMLNDNWSKIDESVAMVDENGKVINKDGTPAGGVTSVNSEKGDVVLTKEDIGLDNVQNYGLATQAESEAGTINNKYMTPQRTKQAIENLTPKGLTGEDVDDKIATHAADRDAHGLGADNLKIGKGADASEGGTTALGTNARAAGLRGTAVGNDAYSGLGLLATAVGSSAKANASSASAIGASSSANASSATAVGSSAKANASSATAVGGSAEVTGLNGTAFGQNASVAAESGTAIGWNASVSNVNEGMLGGTYRDTPSTWKVPGSFTVNGTKNFEMPHPHPDKKETHRLRHSAVESPTAGDNLYRFEIEAIEALQEVEYELPDYFQHLNKNVDVWVNGVDHFGNAYGKVEGNTLIVNCEYAGKYNVLVIGTRNDGHQSVQDWDIKGVEREIGESWTGETYVFEVDEILEVEEIKEEDIA